VTRDFSGSTLGASPPTATAARCLTEARTHQTEGHQKRRQNQNSELGTKLPTRHDASPFSAFAENRNASLTSLGDWKPISLSPVENQGWEKGRVVSQRFVATGNRVSVAVANRCASEAFSTLRFVSQISL